MATRYGKPKIEKDKKTTANTYKVTAAQRAASGKTSAQIVNERTASKSSSPTISPSASSGAAVNGGAAPVSNPGITAINQAQFGSSQQFGRPDIQQPKVSAPTFRPTPGSQERAAVAAIEQQAALREIYKPGGWTNVVDVHSIALNPLSAQDAIRAETGNNILDAALGAVSNNIYASAFAAAGIVTAGISAIGAIGSKTAVVQAGTIGTSGLTTATVGGTTSTAYTIASNTVAQKATASLIAKLGGGSAVAGGLLAVIGTYPFAGFIQEEALQTCSFAVKTAIENGDLQGAEDAARLQDEMLSPGLWDSLIAKVPFANVQSKLMEFFRAAKVKVDIDKRIIDDLKSQESEGISSMDAFTKSQEEKKSSQEAQRAADAAYYAQIEELRKQAKAEERAEDLKQYEKILALREEADKKKRKATLDYWTEYYKTKAEYQANSKSNYEAPSKLNFGLL